jgi:NAD+ diphosphatase
MSGASEARVLAVHGNALLVFADDRMPVFAATHAFANTAHESASLGFIDLSAAADDAPRIDGRETRFVEPRFELGRYPTDVRASVVRSLALSKWGREMRHCPLCASALAWESGATSRACENGHRHFPRTDPATIMLVDDGTRALLGRQATWPPGMYSTLAGFVDAGESAEDAVAREVFEESGVRVSDVRYVGSEPWPFPRSLMLGFRARAVTNAIVCGDELEDVRWFAIEEVRALLDAMEARVPFGDTIARRLMRGWVLERDAERSPV